MHRCLTHMPHTSHITQPNIDVRAGASHAHKLRCTDASHTCLTHHTSPNQILMCVQVPHMHISSGAQMPHTYALHITQHNNDVRAGASHAPEKAATNASHMCLTHHPTQYWCAQVPHMHLKRQQHPQTLSQHHSRLGPFGELDEDGTVPPKSKGCVCKMMPVFFLSTRIRTCCAFVE